MSKSKRLSVKDIVVSKYKKRIRRPGRHAKKPNKHKR